ncbi:MAG: sigma-70 family RNA polymerase sigma factor [Ginsengibacter sp.]
MQTNITLENIINGCVNANRQSQHKFYQYFYIFCFNTCITYCETNDDTVEVVNDGFLKIFMNLKNFKARYENFEGCLKAWIRKIMICTAIDYCRRNRKNYFLRSSDEGAFEFPASEESAVDKLSYDEIIKLVQRLSPAYRIVFSLYVIHGFKHEEIAKTLKITVGTSKSNLAKARMNIQKMIPAGSPQNISRSSKSNVAVLCES